MMKKTLSLLLAAAMLLAALSACGAGGEDVELIESPEPSAEAEATPRTTGRRCSRAATPTR